VAVFGIRALVNNRIVRLVLRAICNTAVPFVGYLTTLLVLQTVFYGRLLVGFALWTPGFDIRQTHVTFFEEKLVLGQNISRVFQFTF
jgi:hypothetical protein